MAPTCRAPALLLALLALLPRGHDASDPAVVVSGCGSLAAAYSSRAQARGRGGQRGTQ